MIVADRLPRPIHMEWLAALLMMPSDRMDNQWSRRRPTVEDRRWIECVIPRTHRRGSRNTPCPFCNRDLTEEELEGRAKWAHRKTRGARFSVAYVRVPPAIRAASRPTDPVAYWIGECHRCDQVMWAPDDGKPAEAAAS